MKHFKTAMMFFALLAGPSLLALGTSKDAITNESLFSEGGIIGLIILSLVVVLALIIILLSRIGKLTFDLATRETKTRQQEIDEALETLSESQVDRLISRQNYFKFRVTGDELGGTEKPSDDRGLVSKLVKNLGPRITAEKRKNTTQASIEPEHRRLILGFIVTATFWLVFGSAIGEYLGIKFVAPELDKVSWLSFGRLRPVHTNTVFWGWASLGMIGLGYHVVPRTSNTNLFSYKIGWISLISINLAVILGNICLMAGINNGGGEYREYIWPVALLFATGLALTIYNYYQTIAKRKTTEIYVSNWYIMGAGIWTLILVTIAYLPFYQDGLGETIIQGYLMHQAVGMWFMTFTLGLVYYYLPRALNKPIYSYSLGVLAFWTQMLFYTLIGTHHFLFSPVPWWLQTVAIVFSIGMFIPVTAGTANFLLTIKGSWKMISDSYVLPFLFIGVIFYFVGSSQGSLQAFRFTSVIWHFTDFNVAHSHITMYGIISIFLWGFMYYLMPTITGRNPKEVLVGMHFWLAVIGLLLYVFPLMIGGTLKGLSWLNEEPFISSVVLMVPYWIWRAIGGSFMFLSHIVFAYNVYYMMKGPTLKIDNVK
ncbi:cbb3-type cytochrome c oxidase subunit I [Fulvivirgaceae bacterium BMA12]|uniref:Cbb3-type cytochrome c oxidase subunit I n=1 Tax=Agaribacillus aureus TaxID=3051825 RepID=A0ABT8LGL8_9BACT|nr:cbb3-type cytochrome c oxidase subunit I [Fulvivirgaceae bacterium BMA12]